MNSACRISRLISFANDARRCLSARYPVRNRNERSTKIFVNLVNLWMDGNSFERIGNAASGGCENTAGSNTHAEKTVKSAMFTFVRISWCVPKNWSNTANTFTSMETTSRSGISGPAEGSGTYAGTNHAVSASHARSAESSPSGAASRGYDS